MVLLSAQGSARVLPEDVRRGPIFLSASEAEGLWSGDRVTVELQTDRRGRSRGAVQKVVDRRHRRAVGTLKVDENSTSVRVEPGQRRMRLDHPPTNGKTGDRVVVLDSDVGGPYVDRVLGPAGDDAVEIDALIWQHPFPIEFGAAALKEANAAAPPELSPMDPKRRDLLSIPHVTIDGEDARDFDDAVAARREDHGVRIWVSIADVASYVKTDTALDHAAQERGTSVYFPGRVIPMLPERLSNDLCSLRPETKRWTLTCEMLVNAQGSVASVDLYPSMIKSRARLTYSQVQEVFEKRTLGSDDGAGSQSVQANHELLHTLLQASRWLRAARTRRGALDLDLPEPWIDFDDEGRVSNITRSDRLESHRVIEDLMIAANEAVARYFESQGHSTVFRIHESPDEDRLETFVHWARRVGLRVSTKDLTPQGLTKLLDRLSKIPRGGVGHMLLLRSLPQARYAVANCGHFGLASSAYLHFTSPIRRYPDLLVHRELWRRWGVGGKASDLQVSADRASFQERRAVWAERAVHGLIACQFARDLLGDEFAAVISGVHEAGVFVQVSNPFIEGMVPIADLGRTTQDYYDHIPDEQSVVARRSGHRMTLGDPLRVQLVDVDLSLRRMTFRWLPDDTKKGKRRPTKARGKKTRGRGRRK